MWKGGPSPSLFTIFVRISKHLLRLDIFGNLSKSSLYYLNLFLLKCFYSKVILNKQFFFQNKVIHSDLQLSSKMRPFKMIFASMMYLL